jgi:hypothetical protein
LVPTRTQVLFSSGRPLFMTFSRDPAGPGQRHSGPAFRQGNSPHHPKILARRDRRRRRSRPVLARGEGLRRLSGALRPPSRLGGPTDIRLSGSIGREIRSRAAENTARPDRTPDPRYRAQSAPVGDPGQLEKRKESRGATAVATGRTCRYAPRGLRTGMPEATEMPITFGGNALMPTPEDFDAVLAVIAANEGSAENGCSNDTIVEATGLSKPEVAEVLTVLWRSIRIEGTPTLGDARPHLRGIRRVLPGRERMWGLRGYFAESPTPRA